MTAAHAFLDVEIFGQLDFLYIYIYILSILIYLGGSQNRSFSRKYKENWHF